MTFTITPEARRDLDDIWGMELFATLSSTVISSLSRNLS